jgi:hypothetical protein
MRLITTQQAYIYSANINPALFNSLIKTEEDLNKLRELDKSYNDIKSDLKSRCSDPAIHTHLGHIEKFIGENPEFHNQENENKR